MLSREVTGAAAARFLPEGSRASSSAREKKKPSLREARVVAVMRR